MMSGWYDDSPPALLKKPQESFGWDGDYFGESGRAKYQADLDAYDKQQAALQSAMPKIKSKEEFMATVKPEMLDGSGKFKGPAAGVNYMLEGMTPDQAYSSLSQFSPYKANWDNDVNTSSLDYWRNKAESTNWANQALDAGWREGPDNGGGVLGGFTRSMGNLAKGIASNPALMAAITAGVAPMVSGGVQSATGWSAATSNAAANGIINGARTIASGGSITDALKSGATSYLGGQAAGATNAAVKDFTGSPIAAKIAGDLARTAVTGGNLASSLVTSTTNAAVNEITSNLDGFDKLDPYQKGIINSAIASAIQGKKITPGLIANIMTSAQGAVKQA